MKSRDEISAHAAQRAKDRYGARLSIAAIRAQYASGEAKVYEREKKGAAVKMFVRASGRFIPIVYHPARRIVITVLPKDAGEVQWGRSKLVKKGQWPSWCCQECGEPVGWIGRVLLPILRFKPFHHH